MRNLVEDFRFALRQLGKSPAYTGMVVLILTLGIGANTAVFSVMDAILIRQLPVSRPDGLYYVHVANPAGEYLDFQYTYDSNNLPLGVFEGLRWHGEIFEELIAYAPLQGTSVVSVRNGDTLEIAQAEEVSGNFFSGVGVRIERGRGFTLQDEQTHAPLAVVSYDYWTRKFARDPGVLGKTVYVKGVPITIVGIAARGFKGVERATSTDLWVPFQTRPELNAWGFTSDQYSLYGTPNFASLRLMARLRPGMTPQKAQQASAGYFSQAIIQIAGKLDPKIGQPLLGFVPARGIEDFDKFYGKSVGILMGLVSLVLLIACTNVALIVQARNIYREREFSLRAAFGANKATIFRQLLVESLVLVFAGAVFGWLFAILATRLLASGWGIETGLGPNLTVLLFTLVVSSVAALSFGLAPLHHAVNAPIAGVLRLSAHSLTAGRSYVLRGRLILVAQIAISLALLMAASLLVRTLRNFAIEDLGMEADRILVFGVSPPRSTEAFTFYRTLLERIRKYPGVESVSMAQTRPGINAGSSCVKCSFDLDGIPQKEMNFFYWNVVDAGFFHTMGIPILAGREFNERDVKSSPLVVIVNETLFHRYLGHGDTIGRKIKFGDTGEEQVQVATIIGVARDSKYEAVGEEKTPEMFYAVAQESTLLGDMDIEVRAHGDATTLVPAMRKIVAGLNPDVPINRPMTQRAQFDESYRQPRIFAVMGGFFGLLAALLVAAGLYGMHTFQVSRRTSEIGVRMAFGANRKNVLAMVLKENIAVLAIGLAVGLPLTLLIVHLLKTMLYHVSPFDPLSLVIAVVGISAVSVGAALRPARRAASVVPMEALRTE